MQSKPKRKPISKDEKIACLLLTLMRCDESGRLVPCISREEAKGMTAEQICRKVQWDHAVCWALFQIKPELNSWTHPDPNHPTNISPLLPEDHAPKTKKDVAAIAKLKRGLKKLSAAQLAADIMVSAVENKQGKRKWPVRPFPKSTQKTKWPERKMRQR